MYRAPDITISIAQSFSRPDVLRENTSEDLARRIGFNYGCSGSFDSTKNTSAKASLGNSPCFSSFRMCANHVRLDSCEARIEETTASE